MRLWEILQENAVGHSNKLIDQVAAALPGVYVQKQLRNTDPYLQYRYGMAVAAARAIKNGDIDAEKFYKESAFSENLTQVSYTDQDSETIKLASELFGVTPTTIDDTPSRESQEVNKVSPIAKIKRNKYGI